MTVTETPEKKGRKSRTFIRVDRPICDECFLAMVKNGNKGRTRYWRCPSCGETAKTIEVVIDPDGSNSWNNSRLGR